MAAKHPMMLKNMAAAWEEQSKIKGHSEQVRKMQNANIKKLFEPLHDKLKALLDELDTIGSGFTKEYEKVVAEAEANLVPLKQQQQETQDALADVLEILRKLPPPPTYNSAMRLVNQTLKNKTNNQKLNLLGNLAGKSSLLSKKQNRITKGRTALIEKQFNLSRKNYASTIERERAALKVKEKALGQKDMAIFREIEQLNNAKDAKLTAMNDEVTRKFRAMYKQWESLVQQANKYKNLYADTIHSSFNTSFTDMILETDTLAKTLEAVLKHYKPSPPPPPRPPPPVQRRYYNDEDEDAELRAILDAKRRQLERELW